MIAGPGNLASRRVWLIHNELGANYISEENLNIFAGLFGNGMNDFTTLSFPSFVRYSGPGRTSTSSDRGQIDADDSGSSYSNASSPIVSGPADRGHHAGFVSITKAFVGIAACFVQDVISE